MEAHIRKGNHFLLITKALLFFFLFLFQTAQVNATDKPKRIVRVGYYELTNFQEYDKESKQYRGYSYDYMLAIAQYANWEYSFVPVTLEEGLREVQNGTLDLINGIQRTDALSQHLSFCSIPSGESCTCLVVSPDNATVAYEDFSSFEKLTVGLDFQNSMNSGFVDYCKDNDCMPAIVYYHTPRNVVQGMEKGEIDAYLVSNMQDVNMRIVSKFDTQSYYFAVTKNNIDLLQELNVAMNTLETKDPYCAEKTYVKYHGQSAGQPTVISDSERQFIKENPVCTVVYNPSWYPFSYTDKKGQLCGAMSTLFKRISNDTGLRFNYVCGKTNAQSLDILNGGKVQIVAGFPYDYTWAKKYSVLLTTPFLSLATFTAYRNNNATAIRCAVPEQSYLGYLSNTIKQEPYQFTSSYDSTRDCLDAISSTMQDITFIDSYQLEYYEKKFKYRNIAYKVATADNYNLSLGISKSASPVLYSIINKEISSIGSDEISNYLKDALLAAQSHNILDVLYANPQTANMLYILLGFIIAILASTGLTMRRIRKKNEQLRAATNAKSAFLSNISHDMRTPLNGIIGYTNLAIETKDNAKVADYLSKIKISGNLLLNLINDTLDISKIESGKYVLNPELVNNVELLESIVIPVRETAHAKNVNFILDTEHMKTGTIKIDRLNMQKVILNLLSNAIKFTPEGGTVTLAITDYTAANDNCNTKITVADNGIGISKDFLPRLYEPFSQEHSPEARETVGTGLGLSIVKAIITLMNGRIEVQSEKGKGTTFTVFLPIQFIDENKIVTAKSTVNKEILKGKSVLLCEDNYMNREIATAILESFGILVTSAQDGNDGLQKFNASQMNAFDAILMDLRMPVLDGYEATEQIRKLPRKDATTVPIIAMSADAYESDISRCTQKGMNAHVSKPINQEILFATLVNQCIKKER